MYKRVKKSKENKSKTVSNSATNKKNHQDIGFMDNRPQSITLQRMSIRGAYKDSEVSTATHEKHVVATEEQEAKATDAYLHSTFVTSDDILTTAVNANTHNFTEVEGASSERKDIDADVVCSLYEKTEGPGVGKPVARVHGAEEHSCKIGVKKGGDEKLKIIHFRKN